MYKFSASMGTTDSDGNIVRIGIGDDPNNKKQKFVLPDVSNSPSEVAARRMQGEIEAKLVAVDHAVTDSHIERLGHARLYGNESEFRARGIDTLVERYESVMARYSADDIYYFFETNAVRLNLTLVNTGHEPLKDVTLVLSLPWVEEFRVSDMLYPPPGQSRTAKESELLGYPKVTIYDEVAQVKCTIDQLEPDENVPAFEADLRIGIQAGLAGKRVLVRYTLHTGDLEKPETGSMKLVFAK
jgi:hypothetical protein